MNRVTVIFTIGVILGCIACSSDLEKGNQALKDKQWGEAIEFYSKVKDGDEAYQYAQTKISDCYSKMAEVSLKNGNLSSASTLASKAFEIAGNAGIASFEHFSKIGQLQGRIDEAYFEKGKDAFRQMKWEEAIGFYSKVRKGHKAFGDAGQKVDECYFELGMTEFRQKAWNRSIEWFEKVDDLSKGSDQARRRILEAKDALVDGELAEYINDQNLKGLDLFIYWQNHLGNYSYADKGRRAKSNLLKSFLRKQRSFEERQGKFDKQYSATQNDVRKSLIFNDANRWSTNFMQKDDFRFRYWEGKLLNVSTGKGGDQASVSIDSRTVSYKAKVASSSPVYQQLLGVESGNRVLFSGGFILKEGILSEYSWTEFGRMENPGFDIYLTDIRIKHK
jgi:hypothetical protein